MSKTTFSLSAVLFYTFFASYVHAEEIHAEMENFVKRGETVTFNLGIEAYRKGDFVSAKNNFLIAANSNDHKAQFILGMLLSDGEYFPADPEEAARWMRAASEGGLVDAQAEFAVMLLSGTLGYQDKEEGEKWLRAASKQGNQDAQLRLGSIYLLGDGVNGKNRLEAMKWFEASAIQGNPKAAAYLGLLHADGGGLPINNIEAYAWLAIAKENGETIGINGMERLESEMTPDELYQAAKRAVQIIRDHKIQPIQ